MRRGSPNPPKRITDAELESMRQHVIDEKVAEHEQWLERLKRQPDPGQGLVPREAEKARQTHLKHIEGTAGELERLRSALPPEPDQYPATRARQRVLKRRAIDNFPRSESEKRGMRERHEAMLAQERKRETKGKLRKLADRRKHPPDPKASSVLAAVSTSDFVKDALERKLRSGITWIEDGVPRELGDDQFITCRVFEAQDVAVPTSPRLPSRKVASSPRARLPTVACSPWATQPVH